MSSENFSSARHPLASLSPSSVNRQQNSKKRSLTSSPSSYGKGPGRHHRRTTLKRSFGVLNLSLGQSPKVEHVIKKKPPTKDRKDPTTMVQSFSELQFEEATRQPALMPTSSYDVNEQEDSPSKCALAHRLGSRRGPLDKAPFTNPGEPFAAPAALSSVKPLQTAFTNSGLRSKKSLSRRLRTRMPDTPCKRPPHTIVDVNGTLGGFRRQFFQSENGEMLDSATDTPFRQRKTLSCPPTSTSPYLQDDAHTSLSASSARLTHSDRADRAVNTADLQSCIRRFTKEFEEEDVNGSSGSGSIFSEPDTAKNLQEFENTCMEDVDIDLEKLGGPQLENFEQKYREDADFPPTPTKLKVYRDNSSPSSASSYTRASPCRYRGISSRTRGQFRRRTVPGHISLDSMATPELSETAPRTPVECMIGLSQQSAAFNSLPRVSSAPKESSLSKSTDSDPCLLAKFGNCNLVGSGEFSIVYAIKYRGDRFAVKRTKKQITGPKTRMRKLQEVEILRTLQSDQSAEDDPEDQLEGKEYVVELKDYWEVNSYLYIMTEYCENGTLETFLAETGKISRLDEWRVWKIMVEMLLGVRYIHKHNILHLDLKPANILITFDGSLKIGDFGVASKMPIPPFFDREGDREYIAPEVISKHMYSPAADIFSCGLILVEIAANIVLPDNGTSWQKLRSGDFTDAGRLSSSDLTELGGSLFSMTSADSSNGTSMAINSRELESDDTCYLKPPASRFNVLTSEFGANSTLGAGCDNEQTGTLKSLNQRVPAWAPKWFQDGSAPLDKVVAWMIDPNPENRPSAGQILKSYECSLVNLRRKSGATIYEGDYGPHLVANNPDDKHILTAEQCLGKTRYKLSDMITRK